MNASLQQPDTATHPYVRVEPAGCYYAVENRESTVARELLHRILANPETPIFSHYTHSERRSILTLAKSGFVTFEDTPGALPDSNLSNLLPRLLPVLSERQRVVLTESRQGLFLDFTGVSQTQAEELAALAASLRKLSDIRGALLTDQLSISSRAFGIVDPAGNSELGFWPLHIGDNVFTLIVLGMPRFNSVEFCTLVWALIERYGPQDQD